MISAIVLAAGRSRRMGAQKLVLPYRGKPMIAHVVDAFLQSPVAQVVVVIGDHGAEIVEALAPRPVQVVANPRAESEMLDSVRCGLAALPRASSAVLITPGDHPEITADVVTALVQSFRTGDHGIAAPTHQGKRGHPVLVAMRYRDEILTRHDGRGLRGLLEAHPEDVFEVEVATAGVLEDIDAPEDYRRALARWDSGSD